MGGAISNCTRKWKWRCECHTPHAPSQNFATFQRRRQHRPDAMFNLALLLQRTNRYAEAADYWRRYLATDCQSEWAKRARRSLKFCEMQINLIASA
jgi:hypothetical protein